MLRLRSDLDAMSWLLHRSSMPITRFDLESHVLDLDSEEVMEHYLSSDGNILAVSFDRYARLLDPMCTQRAPSTRYTNMTSVSPDRTRIAVSYEKYMLIILEYVLNNYSYYLLVRWLLPRRLAVPLVAGTHPSRQVNIYLFPGFLFLLT